MNMIDEFQYRISDKDVIQFTDCCWSEVNKQAKENPKVLCWEYLNQALWVHSRNDHEHAQRMKVVEHYLDAYT